MSRRNFYWLVHLLHWPINQFDLQCVECIMLILMLLGRLLIPTIQDLDLKHRRGDSLHQRFGWEPLFIALWLHKLWFSTLVIWFDSTWSAWSCAHIAVILLVVGLPRLPRIWISNTGQEIGSFTLKIWLRSGCIHQSSLTLCTCSLAWTVGQIWHSSLTLCTCSLAWAVRLSVWLEVHQVVHDSHFIGGWPAETPRFRDLGLKHWGKDLILYTKDLDENQLIHGPVNRPNPTFYQCR